jgi:hypothetical protein
MILYLVSVWIKMTGGGYEKKKPAFRCALREHDECGLTVFASERMITLRNSQKTGSPWQKSKSNKNTYSRPWLFLPRE